MSTNSEFIIEGTTLKEAALSVFTASQISSLLDLAIKCKAVKCSALLIDYRNIHFPEYADVNEFSLDW